MATVEAVVGVAAEYSKSLHEVGLELGRPELAHPGYEDTPEGVNPALFGRCALINCGLLATLQCRFPEEEGTMAVAAGTVHVQPSKLRNVWKFMDERIAGKAIVPDEVARLESAGVYLGKESSMRVAIPDHRWIHWWRKRKRGDTPLERSSIIIGAAEEQTEVGYIPPVVVASYSEMLELGLPYDVRMPLCSLEECLVAGIPSYLPQRLERLSNMLGRPRLAAYVGSLLASIEAQHGPLPPFTNSTIRPDREL